MAVQVPTSPALSAKLQLIVSALAKRNAEYQGIVYNSVTATLRCDAEGWEVRDWWNSASGGAGNPTPAPPQGIKTATVLTASTTPAQCDTAAATMITAIKAVAGPVYVNG